MPNYGARKAVNTIKHFFWSVIVLIAVIVAIAFIWSKVKAPLELTNETMNANYGEGYDQ